MFGALKEKLKGWLKKNEPEEEIVETKKEKKKIDKKKESPKKKPAKEKDFRKSIATKSPNRAGATKELSGGGNPSPTQPAKEKSSHKEELEQSLKETIEAPVEKQGFFGRFKKKLTKDKFEELFEELELILLQNNVAYDAAEAIKKELANRLIGNNLKDVDLTEELKEAIKSTLINPPDFLKEIKDSLEVKSPFVIVFAGINGSGKTTTIAKVANYLLKNKISVCLAAADTFRAASIEQIQQHADKLGVHLIKKDYGVDPAAVGFDAISYAKKNKIDVVLIDTAGRMQNKDTLMKEMEKIVRINKPDMKIFLGESITGNDATEQAKAFNNAIGITGMILSKADVDEKGGTAISVAQVTGKPILFLGTGQEYQDLEVFDKDKLVDKIFC